VALVRIDISEESIASIISVKGSSKLRTTFAVTNLLISAALSYGFRLSTDFALRLSSSKVTELKSLCLLSRQQMLAIKDGEPSTEYPLQNIRVVTRN
jgi:hypothetical protein